MFSHCKQFLKTRPGLLLGPLLLLLLLLLLASTSDAQQQAPHGQQQQQQPQQQQPAGVRIVALFTGAAHDLGIDHRLGRQVLKLALARARRLSPEVGPIELLVHSDPSECRNISQVPGKLAELFYAHQSRRAPIDAILGPSCERLIDLVARMAAYWRTPIYTTSSISSQFARKHIYSTLTRLSPSINHLCMFIVKTLERFQWRHLAAVVDRRESENVAILEELERTIDRLRFTIPISRRVFAFDSFHRPAAEAAANSTLDSAADTNHSSGAEWKHCDRRAARMLEQVGEGARVVLLLLSDARAVRRLLLCAHELRMNNGEFTFLALSLGLKSAGSAGQNQLDWFVAEDEANNLKARQMFESLMVFSVELPLGDEFNNFVEQTLDLAHQEFPLTRFERSNLGPLAVALHDSLLLAVEAQRRQLARGQMAPPASGVEAEELEEEEEEEGAGGRQWRAAASPAALLWNESFSLGLVAGMHINRHGDQELDYVLKDLEPELGLLRPVASYAKDTRQVLMLPATYIHWPARLNAATRQLLHDDEPPPDEPECGFRGDAEHCQDRRELQLALLVAALFLLVTLVVVSLSLRRYRNIKYEMQLDDYWWKINWCDLQFLRVGQQRKSSMCSQLTSNTGRHLGGSSIISALSISSELHRLAASAKPAASQPAAVPSIVVKGEGEGEGETGSQQNSSVGAGGKPVSLLEVSSEVLLRSELSAVVRHSSLALYKGQLVIVKEMNGSSIEVSRKLLVELKSIRELCNENVAKLVGLCLDTDHLAVVYEFCSRGNLQQLLLNPETPIDWNLRYSLMGDIINGLCFIHTTLLDCHGRLKSTNLVLDSRFTVKLTDFGLRNLYNQLQLIESADTDHDDDHDDECGDEEADGDEEQADGEEAAANGSEGPGGGSSKSWRQQPLQGRKLSVTHTIYNMDSVSVRAEKLAGPSARNRPSTGARSGNAGGPSRMRMRNRGAARYFWTAPEHLRQRQPHLAASKRGDIYSLAIVFYEIFTRKEPYYFGSNAKPRLQVIKRDRMDQQKQQRAAAADGVLPAAGSGIQAAASRPAGSSSVGVSQRSGRSKRRSHGAVGPAPLESSEPAEWEAGDPQRPVRIDVSQCSEASAGRDTIDETAERSAGSLVSTGGAGPRGAGRNSIGASSHESLGAAGARAARGATTRASEELDAEEILDQLRMAVQPEPVRPYMPNHVLQEVEPRLVALVHSCWHETPSARPSAQQVRGSLRRISRGATAKNYLDNLLDRLQSYAAQLERIVDAKSGDILAEKMRTEELLYQLLPKFVADKLKHAEPIVPQVFDGVTIFFSDIVGFEKYASVMSPGDLVDLLNNIYSSFESIISSFDVTKIEVILDQFLVAAGISLAGQEPPPADEPEGAAAGSGSQQQQTQEPTAGPRPRRRLLGRKQDSLGRESEPAATHPPTPAPAREEARAHSDSLAHLRRSGAEQIARMALCIRDLVKSFSFRQTPLAEGAAAAASSAPGTSFNIRIGIHSGPVCAGIVGVKRPKFCLIGDAVNVASRMHTNSKANRIQISADTRDLLRLVPGLTIEPRGLIEVKGKGKMDTFWLESSY